MLNEPLLGSTTSKSDQEKNSVITSEQPPKKIFPKVDKLQALKRIFSLAIFPIIGMVFHPTYQIVNSSIMGRTGDPALLGGLGLGGLTLGLFLLAISVTFNGALDTLISQAYGQGDQKLCWIYLNRQLYLTTLVCVPLAITSFFCDSIFVAMGQDP